MISLRHCDPVSKHSSIRYFTDAVIVGRDPGDVGFVIGSGDPTVSSRAFTLIPSESGVQLSNTSTFSECEVFLQTGTRLVFPGESVIVQESCEIMVPGEIYNYRIELSIAEISYASKLAATGTQRIVEQIYIHQERWPVAVSVCAHRFFPDRFGSVSPNANEVSRLLRKVGIEVTPKAVNNKLQRLREDLSERSGLVLETREELVDFLIRQRAVSRSDVEEVLGLHR
jgi:hypothetical protein